MLVLPPEITQREATASLGMLLAGLRAERDALVVVVVDAGALAVFDTSALAVLLECRRAVLEEGRSFAVQGLSPALASMAELYGVGELLAAA